MDHSESQEDPRGWLVVGRVVKPHGVHGDLLVDILTDFPERLSDGARFGVGDVDAPHEYHHVHRIRYHKGRWLVAVRGIRDRDVAEEWRGRSLFLPEQALDELPEGYYYEHHLTGLECRSPEGASLGAVVGIEPGDIQSRLVVRRGRREFLIPYVPEIVTRVDIDEGVVIVDAPPGLLDDDFETA